jgi:hypothetical protein
MLLIKTNGQLCWFHEEDEVFVVKRWIGGDAERPRVTLQDGNSGQVGGVTGGRIPLIVKSSANRSAFQQGFVSDRGRGGERRWDA